MTDRSRLKAILGLEEDEEFEISGSSSCYRIHDGRRQFKFKDEWRWCDNEESLVKIINDPSLIVHKPRFSDEEMTVLRWLHKHGKLKRLCKTTDGRVGAKAYGIYRLEGNIADCLLKPGETVDLDELFKEDEND